MSEEVRFVNTPMDQRQLDALEWIKRQMGDGPDLKVANVDAVRAAVVAHAKVLGWVDPQSRPTTRQGA